MKIVVLAGGISSERDVSLSSGGMIYRAFRKTGHQAILLDVYLGYEGETAGIFERDTDWAAQVSAVGEECPDLEAVKALRKDGGKGFFGPKVLEICGQADCVFLALHAPGLSAEARRERKNRYSLSLYRKDLLRRIQHRSLHRKRCIGV